MIPVLFTFLGLVFVVACGECLRHCGRFDRLALVALLGLGFATRPDDGHHRMAITGSILSGCGARGVMVGASACAADAAAVLARAEPRDLLLLTVTTHRRGIASVGLFGRVFVFHAAARTW